MLDPEASKNVRISCTSSSEFEGTPVIDHATSGQKGIHSPNKVDAHIYTSYNPLRNSTQTNTATYTIPAYSLTYSRAQVLIVIGQDDKVP